MNPLLALQEYGQAVWLDYIRRNLLISGEFSRLINEDGLRGVTSNPSIFEKAITGSTDYTEILRTLAPRYRDAKSLFEQVAIRDIQDAADLLRPAYEQTRRRDGYASLEVSPYLARDTQGTVEEARRLWRAVGRDNVMIKVPATPEGIPAIEQLTSEGINVNVTLLFAQETYVRVAEAYIAGLAQRAAQGGDVSAIASVASFFISRIDTAVDALLTVKLKTSAGAGEQAMLRSLMGKVAIANGKLTYQRYQELFRGEKWQALAEKGAQPQRVLWASTSTKNPNYRDVLYVEELIDSDTINTIPPATLDAFRDHGRLRPSLTEGLEEAQDTMETLARVGISMTQVTDKLIEEGVRLFAEAFGKLLAAVEKTRQSAAVPRINRQTYMLPNPLAEAVKATLEEWRAKGNARRLWAREASLWTGADEGDWLGWLGITEDQLAHSQRLRSIAEEVNRDGFTHALLLGMGGSSLCPEVMKRTFGRIDGYPELHVLDSTDPAQIRSFESRVDLAKTLFIVSSKSGSTLEPNIFKQYFFDRVTRIVGAKEAGNRFVAITDPGSKMQQIAENDGFRRIFFGLSSIGGRYSVLSDFGMVPGAIREKALLRGNLFKILLRLLVAWMCFSETAWSETSENRQPQPDDPWFTGTLLSTRGRTLDQGHAVAQPYFYFTRYGGLYTDNWRLQSATVSRTIIQQTYFIYGLTNRMDVEIAPQWLENSSEGESLSGFGDLPLQLGFQALRGGSDSWLPDVRIWVQEIFPTGRYNNLSPSTRGLSGTGGGSFATTLGIGVQKAIWLGGDHVFRYRVNATYGFHSSVMVRGFNTYGGGFGTEGRIDPGSVTTLTVAGEYSLTQHLVLALDIGFQTINATRFSGATGVAVNGEPATVGIGYSNLLTIAPAVEYNFNQHVGLIAGPWFSVRGKNASEFFGVVAALFLYM